MIRFLSIFLCLSIILSKSAAQTIPGIQWQKSYGGSLAEYDVNREPRLKIFRTSDNGFIAAATSYSSDGDVEGNNGQHDAWIFKCNEKGELQWQHNFGGNDWDWVNCVQETSDGGYIVCGVVNSNFPDPYIQRHGAFDVWILKLSATGVLQWQKFYGGTDYDFGQYIIQTDDGGYIFCGRTNSINGDVTGDHGGFDAWVGKIDSVGNLLWQKCYGGGFFESANAINKTNDGGYIIGAYQAQTASNITIEADFQSYAIKIDNLGNEQWSKKYGGSYYEDIKQIRQTSDGGYIFCGATKSNDGDVSGNHPSPGQQGGYYFDAWIVKLDNTGNLTWQLPIGGDNNDQAFDVVEVNDGYLAVGFAASNNNGDIIGNHGAVDGIVTKLNFQGALQSVRCFGGANGEEFHSMSVRSVQGNDEILVGGLTGSYDGDVTVQHGQVDVWVANLSNLPFQYNSISGGAFIDNNANGLHDFGEPGYDNKYVFIKDNHGFYSQYINSNPSFFNIRVDTGRYETELNLPDTSQYRAVPRKRVSVFNNYGNTDYFEFALVKKDLVTDISSFLNPGDVARPDRLLPYSATYGFIGAKDSIDAIFKIVLDNKVQFVSSSISPLYMSGDTINFRVNNLHQGQPSGMSIQFRVKNIPLVQPGDSIVFLYTIMPITVDSAYFDDWDTTKQVILNPINNITGFVFVDLNNNNVWDLDEPPFTQGIVESKKGGTTVSSYGSLFNNEVDTGTYVTQLRFIHPYYNSSPTLHTSSFTSYYNTDSFDFRVMPIPNISDLETFIDPLGPLKPGFKTSHFISYSNNGTDTIANGQLVYIKNPKAILLNADPAPDVIHGDTLTWNFTALKPQDFVAVAVDLKIPTSPTVNQGDTLRSYSIVYPLQGDTVPQDNQFELRQIVVNSNDPNDKVESHAGKTTVAQIQSGEYLNYTIRFQNTGNDYAEKVEIRDSLDDKLDWSSFKMVSASHPYKLKITNGNKLRWVFDNIHLVDSTTNEPASHGHVSYKIRPRSTVIGGDKIKNKASIYFDFNLPVGTNSEETIVLELSSLPVTLSDFKANLLGEKVQVLWHTKTESNTSHFEIERSGDGINFMKIGSIDAKNLSNGFSYSFVDGYPQFGFNYYKLKTVDLDGNFRYSNVVLVNYKNPSEIVSTVYPNPTKGNILLKLRGPIHAKVSIVISDLSGRKIYSKNIESVNSSDFTVPLELKAIASGVYVLKIFVGEKEYTHKLVLQ